MNIHASTKGNLKIKNDLLATGKSTAQNTLIESVNAIENIENENDWNKQNAIENKLPNLLHSISKENGRMKIMDIPEIIVDWLKSESSRAELGIRETTVGKRHFFDGKTLVEWEHYKSQVDHDLALMKKLMDEDDLVRS